MKISVIGIGSNSVRMLTVEQKDGSFERLRRDREGTRLFAGLDENCRLSPESMRLTADVVAKMAACARAMRAERLHIFATSASRDAANGAEFLQMIREGTGTEPEILSGEQEAVLSFLGASAALPGQDVCGVIDIGGGSTEVVVGGPGGIRAAVSLQMGAVRLCRRYPIRNTGDMAAVEACAEQIMREGLEGNRAFPVPAKWAGTGGTFTTLAAMVRAVPWTERASMHGTVITGEEIRSIGETLADMPLEERKLLPGLQPSRADIVVHGICILLTVMRRLRLTEITVSEWGNLEGFIRERYLMQSQINP